MQVLLSLSEEREIFTQRDRGEREKERERVPFLVVWFDQ